MTSDTDVEYRCTDCKHVHEGSSHGFCWCGCTYPGTETVPV